MRDDVCCGARGAVDGGEDGGEIWGEQVGFARGTVVEQRQFVGGGERRVGGQIRDVAAGGQRMRRPATDAKQVKPCVPRWSFLIYSTCALNALCVSCWPFFIVMLGR